jgi:hypothetical protein
MTGPQHERALLTPPRGHLRREVKLHPQRIVVGDSPRRLRQGQAAEQVRQEIERSCGNRRLVLAENFTFKTKRGNDDAPKPGELRIAGFKEPSSPRVKQIVETDLNDLKATILQDDSFAKAASGGLDPEVSNKVLIPKIIRERYPDRDEIQVEELRQQVIVDSVIKNGEVKTVGDDRFVKMQHRWVKVTDLNINLIDKVNPFQRAFEVLSKSVTTSVLRVVQDAIAATKVEITEKEALATWPKIQQFSKVEGRAPSIRSENPIEKNSNSTVSRHYLTPTTSSWTRRRSRRR